MLCYRFMLSSKLSASASYFKLYDAEILPLLLRRPPATATGSSLLYSTLTSTSVRRQREEQDFIRSTPRFLFHSSSRQLQEKSTNAKTSTSNIQPPPPQSVDQHEQQQQQQQPLKATKEDATQQVDQKVEIPLLDPETQKLGLFARFKKMYKEYWYVLLPVHVVTSAGWLTGFYYLSKSGFDVATLMESWHFNEMIVGHLRDSHLGHVAIAYFLYKCFTPIRYMVTLGGTTLAIKNLSRLGYIRPVPSKDALMKMYKDKKDSAKQAIQKKTHGGSSSI